MPYIEAFSGCTMQGVLYNMGVRSPLCLILPSHLEKIIGYAGGSVDILDNQRGWDSMGWHDARLQYHPHSTRVHSKLLII